MFEHFLTLLVLGKRTILKPPKGKEKDKEKEIPRERKRLRQIYGQKGLKEKVDIRRETQKKKGKRGYQEENMIHRKKGIHRNW